MRLVNETTTKLGVTFLILIIGYAVNKLGAFLISKIQRKQDIITLKQKSIVKHYRYIVMMITIIIALLYLKSDVVKEFLFLTDIISNVYSLLPNIIIAILVITLGIIVANLLNFILKRFFDTAGITEFMVEQNKEQTLDNIQFLIRIFLYIVTALVILNMFGIDIGGIISAFSYLFYALFLLILVYIFFGTKEFVENFLAGIYLKSSGFFKLGQKIRIDDTDGKIKSMSSQAVTVLTDYGYSLYVPNKKFINKNIGFKNIETDLDTLQKIKSYFVAQKPSYCGPASVSMILKIFGYNITQTRLGDLCNTKVGSGTHPQKLIDVVEEFTENKVKGFWIDSDKIVDLKSEIRLWLNQGALIIIDYKKNRLFPDAKKAHYSVVVAVEGDELVVLDPSGKKGGVYLAETDKVYAGMDTYSELIKGKRGYLILAPEGTTAYHRIEEGIIYSDPDLYKELTNKIKKELVNFTQKSEILENVLPLKVKSFIRKWKEKEKIARLWKPENL